MIKIDNIQFELTGDKCISCDSLCNHEHTFITSRLPALGIKINDRGTIRGDGSDYLTVVCLYGEPRPLTPTSIRYPELKQPDNFTPRICTIYEKNEVIETNTPITMPEQS